MVVVEVAVIGGSSLGKYIFENNPLFHLGFLDGTMESLTELMLKRDLMTVET